MPAAGAGTSIVALSLSSVDQRVLGFTVSPGFTSISMTRHVLEIADIGHLDFLTVAMSFLLAARLRTLRPRVRLVRGRCSYFAIALSDHRAGVISPSSASAFSAATRDVVAVHLEEAPQRLRGVASGRSRRCRARRSGSGTKARICSAKSLHVVGRGDHRPRRRLEASGSHRPLRGVSGGCSRFQRSTSWPSRAQLVKLVTLQMSAATPKSSLEQLGRRDHLAQDGARAHQLDPCFLPAPGRLPAAGTCP